MLETKINELTQAILELTTVMKGCASEMKKDAQTIIDVSKDVVEKVKEPVIEKEEPVDVARNYDDLRDLILKANRADADNKPKMKAILEKFKAKKVTDVKESDIEAVCVEIEGVLA